VWLLWWSWMWMCRGAECVFMDPALCDGCSCCQGVADHQTTDMLGVRGENAHDSTHLFFSQQLHAAHWDMAPALHCCSQL
jgi:hypothetical protein